MTTIFSDAGGTVVVPSQPLIDRGDGGHLIVTPPRPVWERGELTRAELTAWSMLVAAAGWAMLESLPQLVGGCINYWEAGNWSLHDAAPPAGPKRPREHRHVHLHLLGRSPAARHPAWLWGEAPGWPRYRDRTAWAADFSPVTLEEGARIAARIAHRLVTHYKDGMR
jgi:hypothetical protein